MYMLVNVTNHIKMHLIRQNCITCTVFIHADSTIRVIYVSYLSIIIMLLFMQQLLFKHTVIRFIFVQKFFVIKIFM